MSTPEDLVSRSIRAEARAVEEGHKTRIVEGGAVQVVSDSRPGLHYRVEFIGVGDLVRFVCDHPIVLELSDQPCVGGDGLLGCKHAALAARRLEREGIAYFDDDGWWRPTAWAVRLAAHGAAGKAVPLATPKTWESPPLRTVAEPRRPAPPAPASWFVD